MAQTALKDVLAEIAKKRDLRIGSLSEMADNVEVISTGNLVIDKLTGVGGLPRGRITELFGLQSSGKTTTALQAAAEAQKQGLRVLYLDFEQAMDPRYAEALGVSLSSDLFLLGQPDTFEDGMNSARELIATGEIGMVIVDSVASMVLERELEVETGDMKVSARDKARFMYQAMRQLAPEIRRTNTAFVFLNHIQDVMPTGAFEQRMAAQGMKRTTTPGGNALKYWASLRLEYKPVGTRRGKVLNMVTNEREDQVIETRVKVTVVKNKVAAPFGQAELRVRFGKGFSQAASVLELLVAHKVIKTEPGGKYVFSEGTAPPDLDLAIRNWMKGEESVLLALEGDPTWLSSLTEKARALLASEDGHATD